MLNSRSKLAKKSNGLEKTLTKNDHGSLKYSDQTKVLVPRNLKQVSEKQMDKILVVFCGFKNSRTREFEWQWEVLNVYICVCIWLRMKKKSVKCSTYTPTEVRRNLVNDQVAPH